MTQQDTRRYTVYSGECWTRVLIRFTFIFLVVEDAYMKADLHIIMIFLRQFFYHLSSYLPKITLSRKLSLFTKRQFDISCSILSSINLLCCLFRKKEDQTFPCQLPKHDKHITLWRRSYGNIMTTNRTRDEQKEGKSFGFLFLVFKASCFKALVLCSTFIVFSLFVSCFVHTVHLLYTWRRFELYQK